MRPDSPLLEACRSRAAAARTALHCPSGSSCSAPCFLFSRTQPLFLRASCSLPWPGSLLPASQAGITADFGCYPPHQRRQGRIALCSDGWPSASQSGYASLGSDGSFLVCSLPCMDANRLPKLGYCQLPMLGEHASALPYASLPKRLSVSLALGVTG